MAFKQKIDFDKAIAVNKQSNAEPVVPELTFWQKVMIYFFGSERTYNYANEDVDFNTEDPYDNLGPNQSSNFHGGWIDYSSTFSPNISDDYLD